MEYDRSNPATWTDEQRVMRRSFEVERAMINKDARTVELSFSSEFPVERWFGMEVLDHNPASVRLERLNGGAPLLLNHDTDEQIGVVESARIEGGKGRALVRFSKSEDGEEIFQDVVDGIRRLVSVGYCIHKTETTVANGVESVRVVDWEPYEISIASVPADTTVGVGRSQEPVTNIKNMSTEITPSAPAPAVSATQNIQVEREQSAVAERSRIGAISTIADQLRGQIDLSSLSRDAIDKGVPVADFERQVSQAIIAKQREFKPEAQVGKSEKRDMAKFSIARALGDLISGRQLTGIEAEMHAEGLLEARNSGVTPSGNLVVPHSFMSQRDMTATGGTNGDQGGVTVQTSVGSMIDLLYAKSALPALGAQYLTGLVGNITFPVQATGASGYHVAENVAPTESSPTMSSKTLSPNRLGTFVEISKQLLLQSNSAIEAMVRNDLATALSLALEAGAIYGTGLNNQPLGLLTSGSGIGSVAGGTDGLAPTWAHIVALETAVANGNADIGSLGYLTNTKVRGKLKSTEKSASTGQYIWSESPATPLNGYRASVTTQVPSNLDKGSSTGVCSAILFGNWSDLVIGIWGGIDIMANPYSLDTTGLVRITANTFYDTVIRRAASFAAMQDALTA